ncbi:MAG: transcription elongation factor GreA [Bacteroidetes bacterium]|nr:transcription elongation factor GreA [Bacteroidota bacterium]MBU1423289.1 transcription elongation factor GreA [Bacteroidota bacterium]MBU2635750.1 transcription elongation factor GreA [Bacteroidota bacterium]
MNSNNGVVYLTRERIVELENELRDLKIRGRADMAVKIAEARAHGDLSENAEYDVAKEAQRRLEHKIEKIEQILSRSRLIESKELPNDKIYILSKVKLFDKKNKEEVNYILVSQEEADFEQNKIAITSPLGKGLLGKKVGDEVKIPVPAGFLEYKILEINR